MQIQVLIGSGLLQDLYHVAREGGEVVLADVALKKVQELDADHATSDPGEDLDTGQEFIISLSM